MKFAKAIKRQKVPEWTEAYIDYKGLKKVLKEIKEDKNELTEKIDDDVEIGFETPPRGGPRRFFVPKFLEESETEMRFFEKLDGELGKASEFYRERVDEVADEAAELNKQVEALVAVKIKIGKRNFDGPDRTGDDDDQILEHVKINNSAVISSNGELLSGFGKEDLKKADEQLRVAFIEFYHKLHLLRQYSFMNLKAISKIVKKYDKITSRRASKLCTKVVDNSYLGNSDEIIDLLEKVENTFIKNFSNSNRSEGMKYLRPKRRREKHSVTFSSGFLSGFAIALLVAVILRIESQKLTKTKEGVQYLQSIFPLYSVFLYAVLHMLMYSINIFYWRKYRINYPFIFGFKRGTELGYREVFLLGTGLAVLALSGFLANLHLDHNSTSQEFKKVSELVPLGLVCLVFLMLFCPLNILYRSSRFFFIRCLFRCFLAPLYPVTFPEFYLADQLTSQTQTFRSSVLYICYYGMGEYSRRQEKCHTHGIYNTLFFLIAVVPYWLRFLQCMRRLFEDRDAMHGYNALTYLSTIVAVLIRTACELKKGAAWMVLALVSSAVAVIVNTYWDIAVDWGLLRRHSKNIYLRDKLMVSHKSVYILAMVLDMVLRLAWMQLVLAFNLHSVHKMSITTAVFCLEIIRRGIWNFFRLENEHLNNVGKYRAFRSIPLPFRYSDDDEDDEDDDEDDDHEKDD